MTAQGQASASLVDEAHELIRRRILDNVWPPGHRALEQEVALALGMSRTPVREALVRLQSEGLVEVVPRHGMRVMPVSPNDMREIYEVLTALECMACELLARRHPGAAELRPLVDIRFALDLYAGVRPIRTWPGLAVPLSDPRAAQIDLVLVRESTEGLFYARGRGRQEGQGDTACVFDTMKISHAGTARVCDFAFELARQRKAQGKRGHVTNVDKANVFQSMAFWRQVFSERALRYPDIAIDHAYVDAMALNLVMKPWQCDVLVTENMFGDILSDLIAALVGGMGMAPSADIGTHHAVFQPAHGTAPDIAGRGIANPSAMLLSTAMMLDWLAVRHTDPVLADGARAIESALEGAFASGAVRPFDFGGGSRTGDIAQAVIDRL